MAQRIMDTVKDTQAQQKAPQTAQEAPKKENFRSLVDEQAEMIAGSKRSADAIVKKAVENSANQLIDKANEALASQGSIKADMKEFDELQKITPEDLALAEQLIFNGYAEYDAVMPNLPNNKFTICSTTAEEMSIIDEILYDMIRAKEDKVGDVNLPRQHVDTMRAALFLAFGFKGVNGKDVCEQPVEHLKTIKRAAIRVKELEYEGEIDKCAELMKGLKKAIMHRAIQIRKFPTPVIDYISNKKSEFDGKMYAIMMSDKIIPKSSGQSQETQEATSSQKD